MLVHLTNKKSINIIYKSITVLGQLFFIPLFLTGRVKIVEFSMKNHCLVFSL